MLEESSSAREMVLARARAVDAAHVAAAKLRSKQERDATIQQMMWRHDPDQVAALV